MRGMSGALTGGVMPGLGGIGMGGGVGMPTGQIGGGQMGAMLGLPSAGGGSSGNLTEKLALQMALQNASRGSMGFMNGQGRGNGVAQGSFGNNGFAPRPGGFGGVGEQHRNFRTRPCRFFQQGMCKNGDRCTFLHVKEEGGGGGGGGPPAPQQSHTQRW